MKILILGDARHGKDTVAGFLNEDYGYTFASSSEKALDIFLYDILNTKYGLEYSSKQEAYLDRVNHRDKWYNEIVEYNKDDPARLAKQILETSDIYVGMRSFEELLECKKSKVFDLYLGVFDPRKPRESSKSNTIDVLTDSQVVVINNGTLQHLRNNVNFIFQ